MLSILKPNVANAAHADPEAFLCPGSWVPSVAELEEILRATGSHPPVGALRRETPLSTRPSPRKFLSKVKECRG